VYSRGKWWAPMRQELTAGGIEEARTAGGCGKCNQPEKGTLMVVVNSICGCAAGRNGVPVVRAAHTEQRAARTA